METQFDTLLFVAIIIFNALFSSVLATLSTVPWGPLFPFKPFNCEACLTFWYTLAGGLLWSWVLVPDSCPVPDLHLAVTAGVSLLISIINFLYVKSKFTIND